MGPHLRYLWYVLRHKWFVFLAGLRLGVPLWRLIVHDWSKFLPSEWVPYVEFFYGPKYPSVMDAYGDERNRLLDSGRYRERVKAAFDVAWNLHQKRQSHHWQFWVLLKDDGGAKALPMPDADRREMLADWIGAGRAITGRWDIGEWYAKNRDRMLLHADTRAWVENMLDRQQ